MYPLTHMLANGMRPWFGCPLFCFIALCAQDVGAPFLDELSAADAADKESLAQHLQLIDEVLFLIAGRPQVAKGSSACMTDMAHIRHAGSDSYFTLKLARYAL